METFGEYIRKLREEKGLAIRKVAAFIDIDPSTLSKIERNERFANKTIINNLSKLMGVDEEKLLVSFFSDKIAYELLLENCYDKVLKVAEQKIKYRRSISAKQFDIGF